MCGFFGALGKDKINLEKYKFHSYRGPDDYNEIYLFDSINKNFAINHSRLEIIGDKIAGKQPVINNNICFAFNGEIFGQELIDYKNSDTLFLFNKFEETIKDNNKFKLNIFLNSLNGFFAIAIFDRINNQILLIRDRYGQKPLYYAKKSQKFCFGSCIKDIRNYLDINIKTNKVNIRRGGGFIYDELNPVDSSYIKQVAPGEIIRYKDGKIQQEFWSEIDNNNLYKGENYSEYLERLDYLLDDAVKIRCHSPSKIALSLSGGYDSSLISNYASKYKPDLQAYTLSVNDEKFNEVSRAKLISEKLNISLIVAKEQNTNYVQYKKLSRVLEIPAFNPSFTGYDDFYSNLTGKYKVILEGHGADEIFGGYPVNHIEYLYYLVKNFRLNEAYKTFQISKKSFGNSSFGIYKSLLGRLLISLFKREKQTPESLIKSFFKEYSLPSNLRVFDRLTLYNNLEHRCPFLDRRIVELAQSTPSNILFHGGLPKAPICDLLKQKGLYFNAKKIGFTSSFKLKFLSSKNNNLSRSEVMKNYFKNIEKLSNNFLND